VIGMSKKNWVSKEVYEMAERKAERKGKTVDEFVQAMCVLNFNPSFLPSFKTLECVFSVKMKVYKASFPKR